MTFLYFAYGSNILPARLIKRCPSAEVCGMAVAPNFRLEFSKSSKDGSGKATLVASPGSKTPGIIFEIEEAERTALDKHEGVGFGYRRDDAFLVEGIASTHARVYSTNTYLATSLDAHLKPFDWYLATIIAGATYHRIDEGHIAKLIGTIYIEDLQKDRETRIAAISAMQEHGVDNYRTLLEDSM